MKELEEENEKLKEEIEELKDKVSELEYDLDWYECECECESCDAMEKELLEVRSAVSRWHDDNHSGSVRFCTEVICKSIEEKLYGY